VNKGLNCTIRFSELAVNARVFKSDAYAFRFALRLVNHTLVYKASFSGAAINFAVIGCPLPRGAKADRSTRMSFAE